MPVPHDYYDYDSDMPHLHNRDHARPYVEPDWQAHAAGHQLPVLSTIGRGPQGDGLLVSNIVNDGRSFSFDIVSDVTGEPIAKIGPIPSGAVHVTSNEDSITFTTNKLGPNNTIATEVTKIDMPKGEAGSIIYLYPDQLERNSSDIYVLDAEKMVAYNRRGLNRRPDMKVDDIVIGQLKDGNDGYLFFGTVVNADSQQAIMVAGQTFIPVAALMGPRGPKGEPGEKGNNGENGAKGDDGAPGISPVCSWNGTVLTITDGTGPHSMDLKGETGNTGQTGADGKSAYQVAVDNGYQGSQADWLASLKGPKGDDGATGATGPQGPAGSGTPIYDLFRNFTLSFSDDHECMVNMGLGPESGLPENIVILGVPDFHVEYPADAEDYETILTVSYHQQYREVVALHFYNPNKTESSSSISVTVHVLYTIGAGTITTVGE